MFKVWLIENNLMSMMLLVYSQKHMLWLCDLDIKPIIIITQKQNNLNSNSIALPEIIYIFTYMRIIYHTSLFPTPVKNVILFVSL